MSDEQITRYDLCMQYDSPDDAPGDGWPGVEVSKSGEFVSYDSHLAALARQSEELAEAKREVETVRTGIASLKRYEASGDPNDYHVYLRVADVNKILDALAPPTTEKP